MDKSTESFIATCREFSALMESLPNADRDTFFDQCLILLPRLVSLGTALPEFAAGDEPEHEFQVGLSIET
jgi:hypothetical protein